MCLSCNFLLAMHTLICVTFSLPPGVGGWLRLLLVALPDFSIYFFFKAIGLKVPAKKMFKGFYHIYRYGGQLVHVTETI